MERLTKWENGHAYYPRCFEKPCYGGGCVIRDCPFETAICERLAAYEDTGLSPQACTEAREAGKVLSSCDISFGRLAELLTADKDGRCIIPPCKVGDRLYEVTGRKTISVYEVRAIRVELFGLFIEWDIVEGFVWQSLSGIKAGEIGKTVFLTREEAEKVLQEMEDKA